MEPLKKIQEEEVPPGTDGAKNDTSSSPVHTSFYEEVLCNIPADVAVFNIKGEFLFINSSVIKDAAIREWL
ncbi:MAG TPA: hypothetical protein VIM79_04045, partial [Niastella sp.]